MRPTALKGLKCDSRRTVPVLDGVNHIRETQIEPERDHGKQEVAPWHGYTRNGYFNHHKYHVQDVKGNVVPSYHTDQLDDTQSKRKYEQ